jgi:hypothetical protein
MVWERKRLRTEKEAMQKAKAALEAEGVVVRTGRSITAKNGLAKREKERMLKCVGFNLMGEPWTWIPLRGSDALEEKRRGNKLVI